MVALGAALGIIPAAQGQIDADRFEQDLRALASPAARMVGTPGYEATVRYVQEQIQALPNVQLKVQSFPLMVPVTRRAEMTLGDGTVTPVYPFWPASVRVNSTPAGGLRGKLVYLGDARFDQIRPSELRGQIAVVESTAGNFWSQAFYFGATAVLVLGGDRVHNIDLRAHDVIIPVNLPRFYLPDGPLAAALREGKGPAEPVTLHVEVAWESRQATNLYALVKPRLLSRVNDLPPSAQWVIGRTINLGPEGWQPSQNPAALVLSVPLDSSSLVPDLSAGASQAAQTAAGLALLRDLSREPLDRPVMVFFSSADAIQYRGTREMLMTFADPPGVWRNQIEQGESLVPALAVQQAELDEDLRRAPAVLDDPTELDLVKDRRLIDRIAKIIETDAALERDDLFRLRMGRVEEADQAVKDRIEELAERQIDLNAVRGSLQQSPSELARTYLPSRRPGGIKAELLRGAEKGRPSRVEDSLLPPVRKYVERAIERMKRLEADYAERRALLEQRMSLYRWLASQLHRDPDPGLRSNNSRLIEVLVSLDLSDGGRRVGPMYYGQFLRHSSISNIQDWRDWFRKQEDAFRGGKGAAWLGEIRGVLDLESFSGARAIQSWLGATLPLASEPATVWGVPGFSMITFDDLRPRRDTPEDTLLSPDGTPRLNTQRILAQLWAVRQLMWHAWNDPNLRGPVELKWQYNTVRGQVVSPAAGRPVPDLPRDGFLATYFYADRGRAPRVKRHLGDLVGVRRNEVVRCDAEGRYLFEGLSRLEGASSREYNAIALQVFRVGPDGAITATSDLGKQTGDIKLYLDLRSALDPVRSLVFNCEEMSLVGLYDPRFLQDLSELILLDARRNADPQRYNYLIVNRMMAGFVEPGQSSHLLFRYGRTGNRLILLNTRKLPDGRLQIAGLRPSDIQRLEPPAIVTSRDFWNLDEDRLVKYARAGVSSRLINSLHGQSGEQLRAAERILASGGDGETLMRHATGAWANESRVYSATRDMANDVIRGAIFLLLLCIPFAFCMERLLIGTPNIYKQLAGMAVIFAIMTVALGSFHPAFRISTSPLIIILAFAIILMSIVVISVVYSKFDSELKKIRSGRGTAAATSFARASVLMSAVLLGIANMRKRRFRTALTSITIILITFAVLCFTSATSYVGTTSLPTGVPPTYSGLMLRQRGFRPLPPIVLENLRTVLSHEVKPLEQDVPGRGQLVETWWVARPGDKDMVHVVAPPPKPGERPAVFAAQGILGLSPGFSNLATGTQPAALPRIIPNFHRLESGQQNIIYLADVVAQQLAVAEGDRVSVGGLELEVAGVFSSTAFDAEAMMLSGEPIAPLNYTTGLLDASGRRLADTNAEDLDLDAESSAAELGQTYEHLSATQLAIVPAGVARMLPGAQLKTVAVRLADEKEVAAVSDELARRFAIAIFAGFDSGVRMVASGGQLSVSGGGQVAIPLAIGGLIIFNTMMGSIAERRREIHVYTSLGLAPLHVGALFVAEALTYGLIGTVFGYIIGQGVGTALLNLGWLGSVTLNYSGTSAILTMGLILIIVLLSALVPARLASKIAAPSIERTWKVPMPKGDEILAQLPFTINKTAADGVLAYLAEYFDAHQEGSIGKFSAGKVDFFMFEDAQGRKSRGLKTVVWLTPFDLGVRQHLMLLIHPGQFEDIYEVQVVLQRLSGDDGSWYRMNRTFLTELRKQFLQWRSLTPQRMLEFIEQSHRLFEEHGAQAATA